MTARERPASDEPVPEPMWLPAAEGVEVYVVSTYGGMAHEDVSTIGRGRGSGRWITIDTGSRHLHTFRAQLVYTPAVLRRARGFCTPPPAREEAEELAALLERLAPAYRDSHYRTSHPTPCLCHTCLVTPE